MFRLQENRILDNSLKAWNTFLANRKEKVALNDQSSSFDQTYIKAGVPQGDMFQYF